MSMLLVTKDLSNHAKVFYFSKTYQAYFLSYAGYEALTNI